MSFYSPMSRKRALSDALPLLSLIHLFMPDRDQRDRALGALWRSGLGVSKLFVRALPDYPYLAGAVEGGPCPAARDLAGRMLTVTNTHWLDDAAFARLAGEICHA